MIKFIAISFVFAIVALACAEDGPPSNSDRSDFRKSLLKECAESYSITCLKLDAVSWVEKLNDQDDLSVLPGVRLVREKTDPNHQVDTTAIVSELGRSFPNDPDSRIDAYLIKKVAGYINSHSIKLNLWNNNDADVQSGRKGGVGGLGGGGGGGGGGKKGGGGLGMILAMGAMMKGALYSLALAGIAGIAAKALMTGLIALLISAIIGLKSLTHQGHSTTYEVISKPIYSHAETHSVSHEDHPGHYGGGHSSYGRSFDSLPLPIALQPGYKPA